jgi:hypothetical protein
MVEDIETVDVAIIGAGKYRRELRDPTSCPRIQ